MGCGESRGRDPRCAKTSNWNSRRAKSESANAGRAGTRRAGTKLAWTKLAWTRRAWSCPHRSLARRAQQPIFEFPARLWFLLLAPALFFALGNAARAQVVPAGYQGSLKLSAGVMGSDDTLQYGSRRMYGAGFFVDAESTSHLGFEAEGRWIDFHQTAGVHAETYSAGVRYHFDLGPRWQPYAKGLVGLGNFTYPYNLGQDRDLVVTAGGGVDFHWKRRIYLRVADLEYQDWPEFHYGGMTSLNASAGIKVRIF
jgi:hypothetical protein